MADNERLSRMLQEKRQQLQREPQQPQQAEQPEGGFIGDTLKGVGAGLATTAQGITGLAALAPLPEEAQSAALAPSRMFGGIAENLRESQSPAARQARQNVEGVWQEGEGFVDNVGSTLGAIAENPRYLGLATSELVGTAGGIGAGARAAGKVAPRLLNTTARRVGTAEGAMVGGLSASEIAQERPDEYAPRLYGAAAGAASGVLGGLGSRIGGRLDPETFFSTLGRGAQSAPRAAIAETGGRAARAATGAAVESTQEGLQEAVEVGFTNLGLDREITEGMGQAFTLGAVTGGVAGGGIGAISGRRDIAQSPEQAPSGQATQLGDTQASRTQQRNTPQASLPQREAFGIVAETIARNKARLSDGSVDEQTARFVLEDGFKRLGTPLPGRAGVEQLAEAFGVTEETRPAFYAALADMSTSANRRAKNAGRQVLSLATGVEPASLPNVDRPNSLQPIENKLEELSREFEAVDTRMKTVGDGNADRYREWEAQRNEIQRQIDALQTTRDAFAPAMEARQEQRQAEREARRERARQGRAEREALAEQDAQDAMIADEAARQAQQQPGVDTFRQQQELFPQRRDPSIAPQPTADLTGQMDALGPQVAPEPAPGLEGQGELFPERAVEPVTQQVPPEAAGVQPETGQLEMFEGSQAQQLPLELGTEPEAGPAPQQLPLEPESLRNRDQFVEQSLNQALEGISQADVNEVAGLPSDGEITLPQIARLANVPVARLRRATRRELTRARGDARGSPVERLTQAIRERQAQASEEQQAAVDYLAEQVSNDMPLGRAISQAPAAIKRVFPRVKDVPPDIRQDLEALRPPKTQGSAGQAEPAGPRPTPRARLSSQAPLNSLAPAQIMRHVEEVTRNWPNKPSVTLVDNHQSQDLRPEVREMLADLVPRIEVTGQSPAAFFHDGEVYILTDQMGTLEDVTKAVYHEMVGHYGLRGVVGNQFKLNEVLDIVAEERMLDVSFYASKYNLDMNDTEQRREAAEEMIAHLAEELPSMGFWQRLVSRLRAFWADLSLDGSEMTDDQIIRDLLLPARNFVARRDYEGLKESDPDAIRLQIANPAETPRPGNEIIDQYGVDIEDKQNMLESVGSLSKRAKSSLMFTMTLMRSLATRAPSTNNLITAWRESQRIAARWERRQQQLGERMTKLKYAQHNRVTDVMVHYVEEGTVPFIPDNATLMRRNPETGAVDPVPLTELSSERIDSTMFDTLSAKEKEVVRMTFETTAEVLTARTQMQIAKVQEARDQLQAGGFADAQIDEAYEKAISSLVDIHNARAQRAYVPTYRLGEYTVEAKSAEFQQAEMEAEESGDFSAVRGMRPKTRFGETDHYFFGRFDSFRAAQEAKRQLQERGWAWTQSQKPTKGRPEIPLEYASIVRLLEKQEDAKNDEATSRPDRAFAKLSEGMHVALREVLLEVAEKNSETASQMDREGVLGINRTHVLRNTLDYVKHFGYAQASAQTTSDRMSAIASMRDELRQLTDDDSRKYVGYFDEMVNRLESPFDNKEGIVEAGARRAMAISSFWYLLTNPSYYALQLTQTWLMTGPTLAGEFGPATAWSGVAKAFTDIKPIWKAALSGQTEVNFEGMPPRERELMLELQARNVLDVGMSHEFGGLGQGRAGRAMQRLYNYARRVELVNRSSAALAAYRMRIDKLTKGKPFGSFDQADQERMHRRAIDFADHITYTTHGDYSYANSGGMFRHPVGRAILQFKKIALIQAELLYEHAKQGWVKPRLSKRAMDMLARPDVALSPQILGKLQERRWLSDQEFGELHRRVTEYASTDAARELSPRDMRFVQQMLQSELNPEVFITREKAVASKKSFAWLIGTAGAISGTLSVPFATTIFAMLAKQLDDDEDEELDQGAEDTINRIFGPEMGAFIMRGAAGAIGFDVSHRIGINMVEQTFGSIYDNFSFADPQTGAKDAMVGLLGPSASLVADTAKGWGYLSDYATTGSNHDLAKGLASVSPLGVRNAIMASLYNEEGLVTDSRVSLIPREDFTQAEIAGKYLGFNPSRISEFYNMRQQFDQIEAAVNRKRLLIKRSYFEAVETGDTQRVNNAMSQWKQLQKDQRDVNIAPSPIAELRQFVVRKRREAQQQVGGLTTSTKNRRLAEIVARIHQTPTLLEEFDAGQGL